METRYYILSRLVTVQEFAVAVRGHWGIENNLHWQLDVSFREDECRVCRDHGPANLPWDDSEEAQAEWEQTFAEWIAAGVPGGQG